MKRKPARRAKPRPRKKRAASEPFIGFTKDGRAVPRTSKPSKYGAVGGGIYDGSL